MREPTELGRVILKRLDEVGWSLAELERNTKPPLSKNTIRHAVYGPNSPQRKTIEILARALDLPVQDLLESSEPPPKYWRFGDWLFRKENRYAWICAGGTAITGILLFLQSLGIWNLPKASVHATQAVVILVLAAMLPRHRPASQALSAFREDERGKIAIASRASLDFRSLWFWAWVSWGLLYAAFAVCSFRGWLSEEPGSVPAARWSYLMLNLWQNLGTVMLFLCWEVLARPTVRERDLSRSRSFGLRYWRPLGVVAALLALEAAAILLCGLQSPHYQRYFRWASGFAQGTVLGLLAGRFDSPYVEPRAFTVFSLYLYAAIQGAWAALGEDLENASLTMFLTFSALGLKCLLYLFIAWLLESHAIIYYLAKLRELDQFVRLDRMRWLRRYQSS